MSWNIEKPGDRINGPVTITGAATINGDLTVDTSTLKVDATNNRVGIGTALPAGPLSVVGPDSNFVATIGGATKGVRFAVSSNGTKIEGVDNTFAASYQQLTIGGSSLNFEISNSVKATLDSNGNLGLGVTPSAWAGAGSKSFDIGTTGSLEAISGNSTSISYNRYFNGQNIYKTNGYSGIYAINSGGQHVWYNAPSGIAGNAISFSAAMTLDASGNLLVGTAGGSFRGLFQVQSGSNRDVFAAQVAGASNGFTIKWNHSTTTLRVNIQNLPTSASGLSSGDIWIDTSAGNVLKIA